MTIALPEGYNIDAVFRLAGFAYGRPGGDVPANALASSWDMLVNLFDDASLNELIDETALLVSKPVESAAFRPFDYMLAAALIETCTRARITPVGRLLETTRASIRNTVVEFDAAEAVVRLQEYSARQLRGESERLYNAAVIAEGLPGEQGPPGPPGQQGPPGQTGPRGETGPQGPQGPQGIQGVPGIKGDKGDTGAQGATGATGAQGPVGQTGPQGPAGADGTDGVTPSLDGLEFVQFSATDGDVTTTLDDAQIGFYEPVNGSQPAAGDIAAIGHIVIAGENAPYNTNTLDPNVPLSTFDDYVVPALYDRPYMVSLTAYGQNTTVVFACKPPSAYKGGHVFEVIDAYGSYTAASQGLSWNVSIVPGYVITPEMHRDSLPYGPVVADGSLSADTEIMLANFGITTIGEFTEWHDEHHTGVHTLTDYTYTTAAVTGGSAVGRVTVASGILYVKPRNDNDKASLKAKLTAGKVLKLWVSATRYKQLTLTSTWGEFAGVLSANVTVVNVGTALTNNHAISIKVESNIPARSEFAQVAFDGRYDSLVADTGQPAAGGGGLTWTEFSPVNNANWQNVGLDMESGGIYGVILLQADGRTYMAAIAYDATAATWVYQGNNIIGSLRRSGTSLQYQRDSSQNSERASKLWAAKLN